MKSNNTAITLTVEGNGGSSLSAAELKSIIEGTNKENPTENDRAALAAAFDKHPDLARIVGNVTKNLRKNKVKKMGDSHFLRESVLQTLDKIERELGYEQAPMASKLLIDQVLVSWTDLVDVQARHAVHLEGQHSMREGQYWDERLTKAQARYLRALETLAKVNRLSKVVPVQVNIATQGGQQINLAAEQSGA